MSALCISLSQGGTSTLRRTAEEEMVETWFKELRMHNGHVLIFMLTLCDSPVLLLIMRCVIYCCDYRLGLSTGKFQSMKLTTNIATPVTCLISFLSWLCFSVPMDVHTTITGLL